MAVRKSEVKVEQVPLASLKAYDGNAKRHDNRNVEAIAKSIEEFYAKFGDKLPKELADELASVKDALNK